MKCPVCGAECSSRFCPDCGTPLGPAEGQPLVAPQASEPQPPAYPAAAPQPGVYPVYPHPGVPPPGAVAEDPLPGAEPAPAASAPATQAAADDPHAAKHQPWTPLRQLLVFGALAGLVVGLIIVVVVVFALGRAPAGTANTPNLPATPRPTVNQGASYGDGAGLPGDEADPPAGGSPGAFDTQAVLDQIELYEYSYTSYDTPVVVLVMKNNSQSNVYITVDLNTYGARGNLLAAKSSSHGAFGPGSTIVMDFWLDEDYATTSYEISVTENTYDQSAAHNLTYDLAEAKDKLLLSISNNGEKPAEWVQGHLLFFKGGKLVKHESQYFGDSSYAIKPGRTITREYYLSEYSTPDYDDIQVVLVGSE